MKIYGPEIYAVIKRVDNSYIFSSQDPYMLCEVLALMCKLEEENNGINIYKAKPRA